MKRKIITTIVAILLVISSVITASGCMNDSRNSETSSSSGTSAESESKLTVVASFYPMYDFTNRIGGERINLSNMVPAGSEPHSWEPTSADIISLEKADVFIYNGAGMEHWVNSVLSALENDKLIAVETAANLELRAGHSHEHGEDEHEDEQETEHDNDSLDPHVWLDPLLALEQMRVITDALIEADPDGKNYYESNFNDAEKDFKQLDQEFHEQLEAFAGYDLIVTHEAFGYLAGAYGLNQIGISGLSPEEEPSPARMAEIIDLAQEREIKVVFFEALVSPKVAETIAEAIGANTAVINTLGGLTDEQRAAGADYISVMRENLKVIVENFEG